MSVASLVREAVAQYLGHAGATTAVAFGDDPADAMAGLIDDGGAIDESVNHDTYLYGLAEGDTA